MAVASRDRWDRELAFERTPGGQRETQARGDSYWYNNYVSAYNDAPDDNTRRMINNQHGFYASSPAPSGNHAKGKGGEKESGFSDEMAQLMSMYTKLLDSFLGQSNEPQASEPDGGFGFEDTVLTRRVLQDDEVRGPTRGDIPRYRSEELRLYAFYRGEGPRGCR